MELGDDAMFKLSLFDLKDWKYWFGKVVQVVVKVALDVLVFILLLA